MQETRIRAGVARYAFTVTDSPFLPNRSGARRRRNHERPVFLRDIGHGVCARRAVRAQHRVDFVVRDQLLVEANRYFRIGGVVADQKLNRTPEDSALLVYMLLTKQIALADVAALHLVPPSDCNRGADPNWLLGETW